LPEPEVRRIPRRIPEILVVYWARAYAMFSFERHWQSAPWAATFVGTTFFGFSSNPKTIEVKKKVMKAGYYSAHGGIGFLQLGVE